MVKGGHGHSNRRCRALLGVFRILVAFLLCCVRFISVVAVSATGLDSDRRSTPLVQPADWRTRGSGRPVMNTGGAEERPNSIADESAEGGAMGTGAAPTRGPVTPRGEKPPAAWEGGSSMSTGLIPGPSFTPSRCTTAGNGNGAVSPAASKRPRHASPADEESGAKSMQPSANGADSGVSSEAEPGQQGGGEGEGGMATGRVDATTKRLDYLVWDDYFMSVAFLSAMRSKDPSTQVGACIVNEDKRIVGIGYNGFPMGCSDDELPWARKADSELDTKYPYVCHAEMNAILNKNSADVKGCLIYVALFPCNECAKLIIQSGIREVVYLSDKYRETTSMRASRRLFELAGVRYRQHVPKEDRIVIDFSAAPR